MYMHILYKEYILYIMLCNLPFLLNVFWISCHMSIYSSPGMEFHGLDML